ncbi:L,D-transpeptidase family protein [uncultured Clostridium sp.]|uniref:L,D-transpeptidase family protein n=1 Tax=uncultured Clostridium sp. TaxID=59620 RepID=UPI0026276F1D|nr:L,D-transpeptidase family protein [uncultured Clostridium sp.]
MKGIKEEKIKKFKLENKKISNKRVDNNKKAKDEEKGRKNTYIAIGTIGAICIGIYLGGSLYFKDRFSLRSEINNVDISKTTVSEAKEKIENEMRNYEITIEGRDKEGIIKGTDIGLSFEGEEELNRILEEQNHFAWIGQLFNPTKEILNNFIKYDKEKLMKNIDGLEILGNEVEPKNASFKYENEEFVIIDEVLGNKLDKKKIVKEIENGIKNGERAINLEEKNCYIKPKYLKDDEKTIKMKEKLNAILNINIEYSLNKNEVKLSKESLGKILSTNKKMELAINEKEINKFVDEIGRKFNTIGTSRNFKASNGSNITVGNGNYGYAIDRTAIIKEIKKAIQEGTSISKEPVFSQKGNVGVGNDLGNTYVEISLGGQHIWFYKNGQLVIDSDIVTGNINRGWHTPPGVYKLTYKQRKAVLVGEDYRTPVDFWMPFNGGIGLHDATWRAQFGGEIYKSSGSHGCVNLPYNVAETIYNSINGEMPIILY